MTIVVDTSVAAKWFVREPGHDHAARLIQATDEIAAPDLIIAELANFAWKKVRRGEMSHAQARLMISTIPDYLQWVQRGLTLAERAVEVALELAHPVYDCFFIACAESMDAVLVTADDRLRKAVADTPFAARVVSLLDVGRSVH